MELIVKVNSFLNGIVMGWPGMILLVGTGVYYTIRCGGVQFKWFGYIMKTTIGKIFDKKEEKAGKEVEAVEAAHETPETTEETDKETAATVEE